MDYGLSRAGDTQSMVVTLEQDGERFTLEGRGNGPLSAFVNAWNAHANDDIAVADYAEHALSTGSDADAIAFVQLKCGTVRVPAVAEDSDTVAPRCRRSSAINLTRERDETGQRGGPTALAS